MSQENFFSEHDENKGFQRGLPQASHVIMQVIYVGISLYAVAPFGRFHAGLYQHNHAIKGRSVFVFFLSPSKGLQMHRCDDK